MANIKITDLTAYTDPLNTDVLPIVDVTSDTTKKVSIADLLENAGSGTAAAPGIAFDGDSNTGIYRPGADQVAISTNGTGRLFIDSSGNVGVGTTSPSTPLHVEGDNQIILAQSQTGNAIIRLDANPTAGADAYFWARSSTTGTGALQFGTDVDSDVGWIQYDHSDDSMAFRVNASEAARIDSSGRLLVGTSTTPPISDGNHIYVSGTGSDTSGIQCVRWHASYGAHALGIGRSRSGTPGTYSAVASGDDLGGIRWYGDDGTDLNSQAAAINAYVDGTPGNNDMPGRLVFSTTADGASSPTERMRISSDGTLTAGNAASSTNGTTLIEGWYTGSNRLNVIGSQYSSSATVIGYAVRPKAGSSGYVSSAGNSNFKKAALEISGEFIFKNAGASIVPLGDDVTLSERMRIDSSGRLLVGTSSSRDDGVSLQVEGVGYLPSTIQITRNSANTDGGGIYIQKSRGSSNGSTTIVQNGDELGYIKFRGADGTDAKSVGAAIRSYVDGTPGTNDMPGRLVFSTTADGESSPTERMRIESNGRIELSTTTIYNNSNGGIYLGLNGVYPTDSGGSLSDNVYDLGAASYRWDTVFAGTGTIDTSDASLKQNIENLDAAELAVATAIKGLIKKYRFTDAVNAKGNDARIHVGVIAQEVEQAFLDAGLDASRYGLFCRDTWYEVDGSAMDSDGNQFTAETPGAVEKTRLGIRYSELLAFVIAAM